MITAANIQAAIQRVDARLLTGQRGFALVEKLPNIALAINVLVGNCCMDCGHTLTEESAELVEGRYLCRPCAINATMCDDLAEPTAHFVGSGQRVIRKTGGLS